jgi:hypothetical protein
MSETDKYENDEISASLCSKNSHSENMRDGSVKYENLESNFNEIYDRHLQENYKENFNYDIRVEKLEINSLNDNFENDDNEFEDLKVSNHCEAEVYQNYTPETSNQIPEKKLNEFNFNSKNCRNNLNNSKNFMNGDNLNIEFQTQRSEDNNFNNYNKIPLDFKSEDLISGSGLHKSKKSFKDLNMKNEENNFVDESEVSKVTKTSNASLLKELDEKWEMIEKEKQLKSRKTSKKRLDNLSRHEKNGSTFSESNVLYNTNLRNSLQSNGPLTRKLSQGKNKNANSIKNKLGFNQNLNTISYSKESNINNSKSIINNKESNSDFQNISKKYYKKTIENRKNNLDYEFESFIDTKMRELCKFRKDGFSSNLANLKNNIQNFTNDNEISSFGNKSKIEQNLNINFNFNNNSREGQQVISSSQINQPYYIPNQENNYNSKEYLNNLKNLKLLGPSVVYDSNSGLKNRFNKNIQNYDNAEIEDPSAIFNIPRTFLNSNNDLIENQRKLNLNRGSNFSNINNNNLSNSDNLDNLVYESGTEYAITDRTGNPLSPSKNLINKMSSLFGMLTGALNNPTEIPNQLNSYNANSYQLSPNMKSESNRIQSGNMNESSFNTGNNTGISNLNFLDKTCTLQNLEKNFEDILYKFSPSMSKNFRLSFKPAPPEEKQNLINDPVLENKMQNLFNKKNKSKICVPNRRDSKEKIIQKIGENTKFLKSVFNTQNTQSNITDTSNSSVNYLGAVLSRKSDRPFLIKNYNTMNNNKVFSKNDFGVTLKNISSSKLKKILNLNNFNNENL